MPNEKKVVDIGHNSDIEVDGKVLKDIIIELNKIAKKQDNLKMEVLAQLTRAEDAGFDKRLVKQLAKEERLPVSDEFKHKHNTYSIALGREPQYALELGDEEEAA